MPNWVRNCQAEDPNNRPYLITEYSITEATYTEAGIDYTMDANAVRSYFHYGMWSALASGHAGTPLKWFGMDILEEQEAVAKFCNTMNAQGILGTMDVRILPNADGEPTSEPVVTGMRSTDANSAIVWVFHDDAIDEQQADRTYADAKADYLKDANTPVTVPGLTKGAGYTITPYNTWSGVVETDPNCLVLNQAYHQTLFSS